MKLDEATKKALPYTVQLSNPLHADTYVSLGYFATLDQATEKAEKSYRNHEEFGEEQNPAPFSISVKRVKVVCPEGLDWNPASGEINYKYSEEDGAFDFFDTDFDGVPLFHKEHPGWSCK